MLNMGQGCVCAAPGVLTARRAVQPPGIDNLIVCVWSSIEMVQCCAAPEMRFPRKAAYDGRSSDLWSLGVVLRALLLGR